MSSSQTSRKRKIGSEFICRVRYYNPLPPVPFPPKLLPVPPTYADFDAGNIKQARTRRYYEYRHTTLDEVIPLPYYADSELGIPIDPCMLGVFDEVQEKTELHRLDPEDEFLLAKPGAPAGAKKAPQALSGKALRALAISTPKMPKPAASRPDTTKPSRAVPEDFPVETQIEAVTQTFEYFSKIEDGGEQAKDEFLAGLRHPMDSSLKAVDMYPLVPNFEQWQYTYSTLIYDELPIPQYVKDAKDLADADRGEMLNNAYKSAFVRPMGDTDVYGRPMRWVECFLPMSNEHARSVRQRLDPVSSAASQVGSDTIEFEKHYEYDLPLNDSTTKQDQCLITFHKSRDARRAERGRPVIEARYVPIRWRGMLKRRRQYQKQQYYMQESDLPRTTHLRITGRELDDDEVQERDLKMTELSSNGPASPRPIEELGEKDETLLPLDVSGEAGAGEDGDNVDGGSHYVD